MYWPANGGGPGASVTYQRMPECSACAPGKCPRPANASVPDWCLGTVPFDPEGLVSSLTAMSGSLMGAHVGHALLAFQKQPARLTGHLAGFGGISVAIGLLMHFIGLRLNTNLFSISFLLFTSGVTTLAFGAAYYLVDFSRTATTPPPRLAKPFIWMGKNAITVYLLAEGGIYFYPIWFGVPFGFTIS